MDWETIFKDLFGGGTQMAALPGMPDMAGQPMLPQAPLAAAPAQQPGPMEQQPGIAPPGPTPTPQAPGTLLGPHVAAQMGQPAGVGPQSAMAGAAAAPGTGRPSLSPDMMKALSMMMGPGAEQRMPAAPGAPRPQVQPFLPSAPGNVFPAGRGMAGPRRGF